MTNTVDKLSPALKALTITRNDVSAWADVYDSLWPYAFAIAYRLLSGNRSDAEEATQDAFYKLFKYANFSQLTSGEQLTHYFATIAHRAALDIRHRNHGHNAVVVQVNDTGEDNSEADRENPQEIDNQSEEDVTVLRQLEAAELMQYLSDRLTDRENQLVALMTHGYSLPEIAARQGITYSSAGTQIHRLRVKIRNIMNKKQ